MKRIISIITSIMLTLSFTLPAELVFAEENLTPETEQVVEQEAKATDDCADCHDESCTACANEEPTSYVPNEVIVVFDNNKALKKAETTAENAVEETEGPEVAENIEVETISKTDKAVLVQSDENIDELALCEELEDQKGVAYAQPNFLYEMDQGESNEILASLKATTGQWNLDTVNAKDAWDLIDSLRKQSSWCNENHKRTKIAVLDTGAITTLDDFADISKGGNLDITNTYTLNDFGGHGNSVTSVIAASNNDIGITGVAAGNNNDIVQVMSVDIYSQEDAAISKAKTSDVISGINYAMNKGAQVIQMCMGHTRNQPDYDGVAQDDKALEDKINDAVNSGIVVTASAGNKGNTNEWLPSDFESVISVINTTDENVRYTESNYGPKKDIAAPGTSVPVLRDDGTVKNGTGTSYAAPVVASVAAMMLYVNPDLTVDEVKSILYTTTMQEFKEKDNDLGWGIVDAYKAVYKAHMILEHPFNQEVPNAQYLVSAADCTNAAVYYKSNDIGESSQGTFWESTFTYGEKTGHVWNTDYSIDNQSGCVSSGSKSIHCKYCSETKPGSQVSIPAHGHHIVKTKKVNPTCCSVGYSAHYECVYCHTCYKDKKGKKTTSLSKYKIKQKSHSYTKKIAAPQYLKKAATKKSAAIYYKSCKWCGKKGKSTFKYGKKLPK